MKKLFEEHFMMQPDSIPVPYVASAPRRPRRRVILMALVGVTLALLVAVGSVIAAKSANAAGPSSNTTAVGPGSGPESGPLGVCAAPVKGTPTTGTPDADNGHPGPGGRGPFGGPGPGRGGLTVTAIKGSDITTTDRQNTTVTVHTSSSTTYMKDCQTAKFSDITVDDVLHVRGTRNSDSSITATQIAIMLPSVAGTVTAKSGANLTVKDHAGTTHTVVTTDSTVVTRGGQSAKVSDIGVNSEIRAEGTLSNGTLTATRIDIMVPHAGGKITTISGSTITVSDRDNTTQTITVTSSTTYTDAQTGKSSSLSALKVGDFIMAEGTLDSSGTFTATAVDLLPAGGPFGGPPHP
jgi:hypothetical protein